MKKIHAIIQARMGSTRLPGKILMDIEGTPILEHVILRLKQVREIDDIIIATSCNPADNPVEAFCLERNIHCIRGSECNVLERFGLAASEYPADIYIRATADNPMIDVKLIKDMIDFFVDNGLTYTCYKGFPIGSGVEIFTNQALEEALSKSDKDYEFEHVTPYMYQRMDRGVIKYYESDIDYSSMRMTVDTEEDLAFARNMYRILFKDNKYFGIKEIQSLLSIKPDLALINNEVHQKKLGE